MIPWIYYEGTECPVKPGALVVEVDYSGAIVTTLADSVDWGSVRRYRVRMPEGYATADDRQEAGDHYKTMPVQPWAAMQSWMTPEQFAGYLRGCALKYLARAGSKGPTLDEYRKARHYLDKLIETMEQA